MGKEHEAAVAELLDQYKFPAPWRAVLEESGMNNTTRMVYAGADKYIMRIYNNHRDPDIVRLEHHVLHELQSAELPYLVPRPVPNERLETVTMTEDGKLGALYHYIEGERPTVHNNHHVEELGRAAGLLILALRQSAIAERPLYKPYYEFEETHGAMTDEHIIVLTERSPVLRGRAGELETMAGLRRRLRELRPLFSGLPQQWIHGDIGFTNALARNESITGLLDFEFCTKDAAAMELAVVLADFPDDAEDLAMERMRLFCRGFGLAVRLSEQELEALPELIKLRMMDVYLHFAGRYAEGLDSPEIWERQIARAAFVCEWIDRRHDKLDRLFAECLQQQVR